MLDFLIALRRLTSTALGCTRIAYGDLESAAHNLACEQVAHIGDLTRVTDAAGNTFIVPKTSLRSPGEPVLLLGSHLDTVIEGGWLDGGLGVAAALHTLDAAAHEGSAHPRLGVVIFRDEEGVRFKNGLFGSRVFAGRCTDEALDVTDDAGVVLRSVVPDPGGCVRYQSPVRVAGFLECHIEQGRRLEDRGTRVGVVTGIVGIRRYAISAIGAANHAGTTEMTRRRDALIPMCRITAQLPEVVSDIDDAVITCGRFTVAPGAPNIVPGRVDAVVESRAQTTSLLDEIERRLLRLVEDGRTWASERNVRIELSNVARIAPVHTSDTLSTELREILAERNIGHTDLPSMAGHDTQHAAMVCPAAMFFVPSLGGISHHPDEDSRKEDIILAGDLMHAWAVRCLDRLSLGDAHRAV